VFAVEREHLVVIETAQTIRAIVTRKALFAHRRAMFRDKSRVRACVATHARGADDTRFRIARGRESVARATSERRVIVIAFVTRERKTKLIVGDFRKRDARQSRGRAFVIGMTHRAGLHIAQLSVRAARVRDLVAHVAMTFRTARRVGPLKWRVAQFATRFEIGVRRDPGDERILRAQRAQRAGAEERAAAHAENQDQTRDEREDRAAS
jgi:hypothetical protein